MTQTPIENPIINSPFVEPTRHFATTEDGQVTGEILARRRPSEFFVPVARPKKTTPQLTMDAFGGPTRQQPNEIVNEIRGAVERWRIQGYPHITATTRDLIEHWRADDRDRRLFFCQLEAAETAIYLTEAAERIGDTKALNVIRAENAAHNDGLPRFAFKMATGSGKTVLMAMLIAWQALNKAANPQDRRFSDTFLVVTPGITIRDRLRVLLPNDGGNYYRAMDIVTPDQLDRLQSATVEITNFHAFLRRETIQAAGLTKRVLAGPDRDDDRFRETPAEMALRVCRVFGTRKGVQETGIDGLPVIPKELEGALRSLYSDYERSHAQWAEAGMGTPPVFIVVCSNTSVSKLVSDWIAGWASVQPDGSTVVVPGNLPLFSNEQDGGFRPRPNTLLVDSAQLDRGDALDPAFRKAAAAEIDQFKREYVERFPGRSAEDISDEDILREVMNTVGKRGRLGEHIRCVVSVAMLTEGWDANTVTHILGIRAFGTQLLCEQVVGRALRRASYDATPEGMFEPEYAEIYGVPFSFLSVGGTGRVKKAKAVLEVRELPERAALRIEFPRLLTYRYEMPTEHLEAVFDGSSIMALSSQEVALTTQLDPIVGETLDVTLSLEHQRLQTIVFALAKRTLDNHFRDEEGAERPWLFPQLVRIAREWLDTCVTPYLKDGAYPQMLLLAEYSHAGADRIYQAIVAGQRGEKRLMPVLRPYDPIGSTDGIRFETTKPCYDTIKSPLNRVVEDSGWESKLADVLEGMPEVISYAKNQGLAFKIPYTYEGRAGNYVPDFLIRLRDPASSGPDDLLTLILEVTGEARKDKAAKVAAAEHLWVEAVNNWAGLGRWAFLEVTDPWDAEHLIRARFLDAAEVVDA